MTPPPDPILYSFRRCPYAMRARLAIWISGTVCTLREVKLSAKPDAMLSASPKGTVPVLVLPDGRVIDESLDIMRWALCQHDPENWLSRDDDTIIATNDGPFKLHLDRYKYPDRYTVDLNLNRDAALNMLKILDGRLAGYAHLSGMTPGLTDAAIVPFVRQFAQVDSAWFAEQPVPNLHRWLAGHLSSEAFAAIMVRVTPWSPGADSVRFGRVV